MRSLLVTLLVCCIAPIVRADDTADAKAHYQLGASAYDKGRYDEAIREFEASYQLSKRPEILWNLARAAEKMHDDARAVGYLQAYLQAAPDAPDVPSVRAEMEALQRSLANEKAKADAEAAAARAKAQAEAAQKQAEAAERQAAAAKAASTRPRWPGYAALATGVALVGGGVALGLVARSASNEAQNGTATTGAAGRFDLSVQSRGQLTSALGIACDVLGGVLVAGGVGLTLWARKSPGGTVEKQASLAPAPGGLVVAGSF